MMRVMLPHTEENPSDRYKFRSEDGRAWIPEFPARIIWLEIHNKHHVDLKKAIDEWAAKSYQEHPELWKEYIPHGDEDQEFIKYEFLNQLSEVVYAMAIDKDLPFAEHSQRITNKLKNLATTKGYFANEFKVIFAK